MNNDLPPNLPPDFPLPQNGFPMRQLKRLHRELTSFEIFIQMNTAPEDFPQMREDIRKIYAVQEIIEEFIDGESERIKIIKG